MYALTIKGRQHEAECKFLPDDTYQFVPDARGLPPELLEQFPP